MSVRESKPAMEVLNPSPSSRTVPFSGNLDQLEVQKGTEGTR